MSNGVNSVRESIKKRKAVRLGERKTTPSVLPLVATFEEKHGFDDVTQYDYDIPKVEKVKPKQIWGMYRSFIGAIIFFFACLAILQTNFTPLEPSKAWLETTLKNEFPFAKVATWYGKKFGDPLALTSGGISVGGETDHLSMPIMGEVVETFTTNGTGIMISPKEESNVSAANSGVVIFAGNDRLMNKTVVVQHADNSKSTYGYLSSIDVYLYQFVNQNELIGSFNPTEQAQTVYFSIEKENIYIDPTEVIPVDVQP